MTAALRAPLLSIVIPTRNRYETLFPTLNALLENIVDSSYEIVVEDNSDHPLEALNYIEHLGDARIRYAHSAGHISIVENTEAALSRARGEYITFIGDDDLVVPNIIDFVRHFLSQNIEAVIYPPAYYWWPSVRFASPTKYHQPGAFWYPKTTSFVEHRMDTAATLNRVTSEGAVAILDLPRVYHGLVRRKVLESIKKRCGYFVNGASPDMALAIATAFEISTHIKIHTPLTVYGASKNSGGGWTAAQRHFGKVSEQAHLPQYTKDLWSERLPPIWSEHTIYPQTAMEVMRSLGRPDAINYGAFYASMLVNEPHLRSFVWPFVARYLTQDPSLVFRFVTVLLRKFVGRLYRAVRPRVFNFAYHLDFFGTPDACMKHLAQRSSTSVL